MIKLYCPKGHEVRPSIHRGCYYPDFILMYCINCRRPYFEIDCLTEPKTVDIEKKMSTESQECEHVNGTNVVDIPKTESQIAVDRVVEALDKVIKDLIEGGLKRGGSAESSIGIWGSFELLKRNLKELNK